MIENIGELLDHILLELPDHLVAEIMNLDPEIYTDENCIQYLIDKLTKEAK